MQDFAKIKDNCTIDLNISETGLRALNIDKHSLDKMNNKILTTMIDKLKGELVNFNTITTIVSENPGTIEEVYEPFLIKEKLSDVYTPRKRSHNLNLHIYVAKYYNPPGLFV
ncbi:MAG: Holliday junction DNA helicase RuvB C-terminal domain-containing protein [Flavobacteriales bacterium]